VVWDGADRVLATIVGGRIVYKADTLGAEV